MADVFLIPLRNRDGDAVAYAAVDIADRAIGERSWCLGSHGYAVRDRSGILLHRELLGLRRGDKRQVDHINRDRLDNRRSNLRVVTSGEQGQNRSGERNTSSQYRGVSLHKASGKWRAYGTVAGHTTHIGVFANEEQAAAAAAAWRTAHMTHNEEHATP